MGRSGSACPVLFGSLAGVGLTASIGGRLLVSYAPVVQFIIIAVATLGSLGGLWSVLLFADGVRFLRRGFRIRQLAPREFWRWANGPHRWIYEEWAGEAGIRDLVFVRDILGDGYPAPGVIRIPSEAECGTQVPDWAQGRRGEIAERIRKCCGSRTSLGDTAAGIGVPQQFPSSTTKPDCPAASPRAARAN